MSDYPQRLAVTALVNLPFKLNFATITTARSGRPYDITAGTDLNHDGLLTDRPPGLARDAGRGTPVVSVDLHLGRTFTRNFADHKWELETAVDAFNARNHPNFSVWNSVLTSPAFGQPVAALPGRQMQFAVSVRF